MSDLSWKKLDEEGLTYSEEKLTELLNDEVAHGKRITILKRLHQRIGVLRQRREWEFMLEMMK